MQAQTCWGRGIRLGALLALLIPCTAFAQDPIQLPPLGKPVADTSPALAALKNLEDADTALALTADGALLYQQTKVKLDGYQYCSLAVALAEQGEFRASARAASQALYVGLQSKNDDLQAKAWRDLALAYGYAGNLDNAELFAREALKHTATDPTQVTGPAWKVIGDVQARRGDYVAALQSYQQALAGSSDRYRPLVQLSTANALIDANQPAAARQMLQQVQGGDDPVLANQLRRTDARLLLREGKPADARKVYQQIADTSRGDDAAYTRFWANVGIGRSDLALGNTPSGLAALTGALGGLDAVRAQFRSGEFKMGLFADVQQVFDQAIDLSATQGDAAGAFDLSERSRARALLDAVRGRGKTSQSVITLEAARKLLRPDERVLEFHALPDRLLVWVIGPDGIRQHAYPVPLDQLTKLVTAYRDAIINGRSSAPAAGAAIGELLIQPLGLQPGQRLIVIPYGPLHYLPFQALQVDGQYLIEQHPIATAPSLGIALQLMQRGRKIEPRLVAFGNPEVAPRFALPGSEAEVHALAGLFPQSQVYLRAQATKAQLKRSAAQARLLHVAAHAQADALDPLYSRILLANADGKFDFLEAREVFNLDLGNVALVTLSACESGLGRVADGDEVLGFTRAFLSAGADSMVVSLWPVSDEATKLLMGTLYGELAKGADLQAAMQHAQLAVLHHAGMQHPFFWAPFDVIGNWRLTVGAP